MKIKVSNYIAGKLVEEGSIRSLRLQEEAPCI